MTYEEMGTRWGSAITQFVQAEIEKVSKSFSGFMSHQKPTPPKAPINWETLVGFCGGERDALVFLKQIERIYAASFLRQQEKATPQDRLVRVYNSLTALTHKVETRAH